MTDRFSAQLRQHLVDTANEQPADGQLAALADRVATTSQRGSLIAGLTWNPGRVGPFSSAGFRVGLIAVAVALATVGGAMLAGGGPQPTQGPITATESPPATPLVPGPTPAATPAPTAEPGCIQFDSTGVYTANVGTLPVGVSVPGTPTAPWRGDQDTFFLGKASCAPDAGASPFFLADLVAHVYEDACRWKATEIEVPTAFAAAEALAAQTGHPTTAPVETEAGAFRATRIDISVPATFDDAACDDGVMKLYGDRLIVPGLPLQVYVMEVDGSTVVMTASYDPAKSGPADLQQIDEIIASLRVDM